MTTSFVLGILAILVILGWMIWSRKQEAHHLDDIHIVDDADRKDSD